MTNGDLAKGSADNPPKRYHGRGGLSLKKLDRKIDKVYNNIKQEVKVRDSVYSIQPTRDNDATNILSLSAIPQGDTQNDRDGLECNIKSIQLKGQIYQNTAIQSTSVRLIIFMDKNYSNGVAPVPADVLESATFGQATAPYSMRNVKTRDRFKILYDKVFTVNNTGANTLPFNIYRRINSKTTYSGNLLQNYGKNTIFALFMSGQSATQIPTAEMIGRVSFTDS